MRTVGFSLDESIRAPASLESYTVGFTVHQRVRAGRHPIRDHDQLEALPVDEFPDLRAAAAMFADWSSEERFISGLDWLIVSLRREFVDRAQ